MIKKQTNIEGIFVLPFTPPPVSTISPFSVIKGNTFDTSNIWNSQGSRYGHDSNAKKKVNLLNVWNNAFRHKMWKCNLLGLFWTPQNIIIYVGEDYLVFERVILCPREMFCVQSQWFFLSEYNLFKHNIYC